MTKHIEEARKLETYGWVVKLKGSCKVGSFFVYEQNFDYLEGWDRKDYEVEPLVRLSDAQAAWVAEEQQRQDMKQRLIERSEAAEARIAELERSLATCEDDRIDRIEQCDRMANDWADFCASVGVPWGTHEAVAHEINTRAEAAEAGRAALKEMGE